MSTFDGVLQEYPLISIDRFLEHNFSSTVYFLSHCHKDHMHGLNHQEYYRLLIKREYSKIYLSDVSGHLLRNDEMYQHLTNYLVELRIEEPTLINIYDEEGNIISHAIVYAAAYLPVHNLLSLMKRKSFILKKHSKVTVTLLTAGHCPGSVMFYFEGDNGNILYTGDFRLPVGSAKRLIHLHEANGRLKPLKSLYIDTTFCKENSLCIPSREECLNEILSIVEPWLSKGPNHIVYFLCPYELAYEFVFVELHKRFGHKTHVVNELGRKYVGIKQLESAVTVSASEARIHACILDKDNKMAKFIKKIYAYDESPCGFIASNEKPVHVIKIKPSAMFFTKNNFSSISDFNDKTSLHRVYYSTHPSLSEIRDMVFYLRPKRVFPNVVHGQTAEEILDLIFNAEIAPVENQSEISQSLSIPPLGKLRCPSPKDVSSQENDSLPFFDDCYAIGTDKKNITMPSAKRSQSFNLNIDTDYENTKELETMLREEIFLQKMENRNYAEMNKSPLKWQNPVASSDEEIFESSSDSSVEDDDSDTYGEASQERVTKSSQESASKSSQETASKSSHRTDIKPFPEVGLKSSQEFGIKSSLEKNDKINDINICKTQLINFVNSSAKSTESESLINDQYVSNLYDLNYNSKSNIDLPGEILSQIDKEYSRISEIDNGVNSAASEINNMKNVKFNEKSFAPHAKCRDEELQNLSTNYINISSLKCKNDNIASSSKVHFPNSSTSEKLKTGNELRTCVNYLNIKKDEINVLKNLNFTANNCANISQNGACRQEVESKNQCFTESKEPSIKINGQKSKSFRFVKKINSSSESEDEYDFKYVIKISSENHPSSKIYNQKKRKPCSSNSIVNHNKDIPLSNNVFQVEKKMEAISTISAKNQHKEKLSITDTSVKMYNSQVKIDKTNTKTDIKCNDKSENQSRDNNKCDSYNSLKCQSQSHKDSYSKDMTSKLFNNHKYLESIFINTEEVHSDSGAMKTSIVFQEVNAPVKSYQNTSLNNNEVKTSDPELIDLSSDHSSGEIFVVNPMKDSDCKNLSNTKTLSLPTISFTENRLRDRQQNCLNNSELILSVNKENISNVVDNSTNHKNTEAYNSIGGLENVNAQQTSSMKKYQNSLEILPENNLKNEQSTICENKALEKISSSWEIKSSSGSSVIIEEVLSSSDLDDSPSLIAPNVPKTSNSASFFTGSFCDLKRRKIDFGKSYSFEVCDKNSSKICDNFTVDSDSTPELLDSNLSKNEFPLKKIVPEIIIHDDDG